MNTVLQLEHVSLRQPEKWVLNNIQLSLHMGQKVALLGRNGSGKSTLLQALAGLKKIEEGSVWQPENVTKAYVAQENLPENVTLAQYLSQNHPFKQLEADIRQLESHPSPENLLLWQDKHTEFEASGGYEYPLRLTEMLSRFAVPYDLERSLNLFSGGEQTRLKLALALLSPCHVLLLDEPTNHLDIAMREHLQHLLKRSKQAVVLVSHDRVLLDAVASHSWYVEAGTIKVYSGGFSSVREQRAIKQKTEYKAFKHYTREKLRLRSAQHTQALWGKNAEALKSRLARLKTATIPKNSPSLHMRLQHGNARASVLLSAEHLSLSYGKKIVLNDVSLKVRKGDRIALIAPNGSGKTTLLQVLQGMRYAQNPEAKVQFAAARTAYLDQQHYGLGTATLQEQFMARYPETLSKKLLGQYDLMWAWEKTPSELSGGEQVRAGLALLAHSKADVLFLDEPTNHLDIETLESLERALQDFSGACIMVTHDRQFAYNVANRFWTLENGKLIEFVGIERVDPARELLGDPPAPPPPPSATERMEHSEERIATLEATLLAGIPSFREEGRLRSELHHLKQQLLELYSEVYAFRNYQHQVKAGILRIRSDGTHFWAANAPECPELYLQGNTLYWTKKPPEAWYKNAMLGATVLLLFERYGLAELQLPEYGKLTSECLFQGV